MTIPKSWVECTIEDIFATLEDGRTLHQGWSPQCEAFPSGNEKIWGALRTTAIQSGSYHQEHNKCLPQHLTPRPLLEVKAGDILITCAGPRVRCGVVCLVRSTRSRLMISGKMYRFRMPESYVDPRFIELFLQTIEAQAEIDRMKTGGSDSGLNLTHDRFRRLRVPLAPFNAQTRIVQEIEKQFTRLDAAVAALMRVQVNLWRYRASVLKAASEGRLVASTSESSFTASLVRPVKELIAEPLANGRSPTSAASGAKILRLTSMQGNFMDFSKFRFGNLDDQNRDNLRVQEGDIFVARGSGSVHLVGRASLARTLPSEYIAFPDTMIRIRLNPAAVEPLYFIYLWNSAVVRCQIEGIARTTAGIHKISQRDIENIRLPLVPLVDQRKVILALEQKFSMIDAVERTTALDSTRAERLRQAILKTAFEGKLVSQDPTDEPASVLLERIRAGRNATHKSAPTPSRGRRKKEAAHVS